MTETRSVYKIESAKNSRSPANNRCLHLTKEQVIMMWQHGLINAKGYLWLLFKLASNQSNEWIYINPTEYAKLSTPKIMESLKALFIERSQDLRRIVTLALNISPTSR